MSGRSVKIKINNSEFSIRTDEDESYVNLIADEINDKITEVKLSNPGLSSSIVNALVMMDLCDRAHKAEKKAHNNKKTKVKDI